MTETEYAQEAARLVVDKKLPLSVAIDQLLRNVSDNGRKVYLRNQINRRASRMIRLRETKAQSKKQAISGARANEIRHANRCD